MSTLHLERDATSWQFPQFWFPRIKVSQYDLYDGVTNKNEQNEYVCQYRPDGDTLGAETIDLDPVTLETYGNSSAATLNKYRIVKAHLGPKAGFPQKELNESNFTVEVNFG